MPRIFRNIFTLCCLLFGTLASVAQGQWPSPEAQHKYNEAHELLVNGNVKQSIVLFQQVQKVAPYMTVIYRDLGQAYYLTAKYEDAIATLESIIKSKQADEQSYQIMVACMAAAGERKKAISVLENGITLYPHSGLLYHELGKIYEEEHNEEEAISNWVKGIRVAPAYRLNYFELAHAYLEEEDLISALLYGEAFVNMEMKTNRADDARRMMVTAYRKLFFMPDNVTPKYGEGFAMPAAINFKETVKNTLISAAGVMDDGMNIENLIMLRARFVMDWEIKYAKKYPVNLFAYQDTLLRNGYFDAYNQWLLGKAVNRTDYEQWEKFHSSAIAQFEVWSEMHPLKVTLTDFCEDKDTKNSSEKHKK
ncbi:MAG: tetratricopeptide repeat protein [Bacteroidota bacterium]